MSDCELDDCAIASAHYNKPCYASGTGSCSSGGSDSDENFQDVNAGTYLKEILI